MKNTVLNKFVPFIPLVRSSAKTNARMFIVITETIANFDVNSIAPKKFDPSSNAFP